MQEDDGQHSDVTGQISPGWHIEPKDLPTRHKRSTTLHNVKLAIGSRSNRQTQNENIGKASRLEDVSIRRVKSLSDFHDAVRSQMRAENDEEKRRRRRLDHAGGHVQFSRWSRKHRSDLLRSGQSPYHLYRDQLKRTQAHLDQLLSTTSQTLNQLTSLSESFRAVDDQTTEFQSECETILADQKKSTRLAKEVAENLQYYDYLEPTTRRLNSAGAGSLVRRSEFPEILANVDTCLQYMLANPKQKEATAYGSKYRLLLTRGLTLIRNQFTASLKDVAADVSKRATERKLNDTAMSALLYAKFKNSAAELKGLSHEIAIRVKPSIEGASGSEGEYQGLLNELYQSYITTRAKLLQPLISRKMTELATNTSSAKDLVAFAHSSTNFMRSLCSDEYALWAEWFDDDEMLYTYLETLCESLYDHLRPRIIHETKLNKLCDTCSLIQARYGQESDDESGEGSEEEGLDFSQLIRPALQDAQDRLAFLAQGILRNDIQYFKPKPEHLDYPRKASRVALSGSRKQPTLLGVQTTNGEDIPGNPLIIEEDSIERGLLSDRGMQEYYPTLRQAIWLLGRLYRLVQSTVFDSLAHEVVHYTTLSLDSAAEQIATRVSPTDSNLFLLSHLLALKHHTLAFEIETAESDVRVDFPASIWDLRDGVLNPAKWYRAIGGGFVPRVVTDTKDARLELDTRLRSVIGDLVSAWSSRMAAPILQTNGGTQQTNGEEKRGRTDERKSLSLSSANNDAETGAKLRQTIEREVPLVRRKLEEYLHDQRTRDMLLRAVLEDVLVKYVAWLEAKGLDGASAAAARRPNKGKGRADGVWEEQAFADWAVGAFGIDPALMDAEEGDERDMD